MGCGCGGNAGASANKSDTLGYRAFLPNGEVLPPAGEPPYFAASEGMRHVTLANGGTVRRIDKNDPDDAFAIMLRERGERHLRAV